MTATKLSLPSRIAALQYKVFDRMRHPRAFEIAREEGIVGDFEGLRGHRQCLIVTFKRSGEPVPTPVNFGLSESGKLYFRSEPHVAKVRRLGSDPRVRVCPCSLRGKPRGRLIKATARVVPEPESERAASIVAANWRFDMKPIEHAFDAIGVPVIYIEVTPADDG
jgi:PPOX class probable F420-dependent enzyme